MKERSVFKNYKILSFIFLLCSVSFVLCSCIRLSGGAGVWKKSADEEYPETHSVGFDTQQIIPQKDDANITV